VLILSFFALLGNSQLSMEQRLHKLEVLVHSLQGTVVASLEDIAKTYSSSGLSLR
jgi:hypothetical protein